MTDHRIHRAASADGTTIAGRVHGEGPPLVLVHGRPHDGDVAWEAMLPHLTDHFTCFLPSTRGRGLSDDHTDHSPPRLHEDFDAFLGSIGEPVLLAGWSTGALWALGVAAGSDVVTAVATFEPTVIPVMQDDERASLFATIGEMRVAADDGRLVDATRAFHAWLGNEDEIDALGAEFFDRCAPVVPPTLRSIEQGTSYDGPQPTDPEVLKQVTAPVLLMRGERTRRDTFYAASEAHLARHLADPHVREPLRGLGHWAPVLEPEPVAREMVSFFESVPRPAS